MCHFLPMNSLFLSVCVCLSISLSLTHTHIHTHTHTHERKTTRSWTLATEAAAVHYVEQQHVVHLVPCLCANGVAV